MLTHSRLPGSGNTHVGLHAAACSEAPSVARVAMGSARGCWCSSGAPPHLPAHQRAILLHALGKRSRAPSHPKVEGFGSNEGHTVRRLQDLRPGGAQGGGGGWVRLGR